MFLPVGLLLCTAFAFGQGVSGVCGISPEDQAADKQRLFKNIETVENGTAASDRNAIQYVPIHFHLVGDASGNGRQLERKVLDQLCDLNFAYAPMDIRFYLSPHPTYGLFDKSINSDNVYTTQTASFLMSTRRHNNAVNVYVVNECDNGNNQPGLVLAYYKPNADWIVSRKSATQGGFNGTLPHEMGHLFSLIYHTFNGWEDGCFDSTFPTWPIAPAISPGGVPTERQDGSNCTTAGDFICDTPPDYNFGFCQGNCNPYTGGAKDPLGVLVDPMENNLMSYFSDCGMDFAFTPMQSALILADLASPERNFLDNNFVPASTTIDTPLDLLVSPAAAATTAYYDQVLLEWQSVTGATYYLLEVDISSGFSSPLIKSYVVTGTSKMLTDLTANKTYYWRIRPFNEYVTCADSRQRSFKTSTIIATSELKDVSAWQISPNPLNSGNKLRLAVDARTGFEAAVHIVTTTGQTVYNQQTIQFSEGESTVDLPLDGLTNGIYFVVLENGKGQDVRKLVVLR